jgi:hypothetical protein
VAISAKSEARAAAYTIKAVMTVVYTMANGATATTRAPTVVQAAATATATIGERDV